MQFSQFALLVLLNSSLVACVHVDAPPPPPSELRDTVVVIGNGEAQGNPDIVRIQLGVEARADNAKLAIEAANAKMAAVTEVLKKLGVAAKDLQTSEFNINSEMFDPRLVNEEFPAPVEAPGKLGPPGEPIDPRLREPRITYRVSNMLRVTLRDLGRVGEALSQAVEAGANQAWGVSFDVEDPNPLGDQARAKAVADAQRQAAELARLAGIKLGRVVSVTDDGFGGPPQPMPMAATYGYEAKAAVPVQSGQLGVTRRVRMVFAIEPAEAK